MQAPRQNPIAELSQEWFEVLFGVFQSFCHGLFLSSFMILGVLGATQGTLALLWPDRFYTLSKTQYANEFLGVVLPVPGLIEKPFQFPFQCVPTSK